MTSKEMSANAEEHVRGDSPTGQAKTPGAMMCHPR